LAGAWKAGKQTVSDTVSAVSDVKDTINAAKSLGKDVGGLMPRGLRDSARRMADRVTGSDAYRRLRETKDQAAAVIAQAKAKVAPIYNNAKKAYDAGAKVVQSGEQAIAGVQNAAEAIANGDIKGLVTAGKEAFDSAKDAAGAVGGAVQSAKDTVAAAQQAVAPTPTTTDATPPATDATAPAPAAAAAPAPDAPATASY